MLLIGLGVTVVAGGAGVHYWNQRHQMVHAQLLDRFADVAPELSLVLGNTYLDGLHRLTLSQVELRDRKTNQPLFRARTVTVNVDPDALMDRQQIAVRSVEVDGAETLLVRREDGSWNWQDYEFHVPRDGGALPQVDIRQVRVQLHLKHGDQIPSARLVLTSPEIQAVPSSAHSLDLQGAVVLEGAGELQLSGSCDLATGAWSLGGELHDMMADRNLLELAQSTSPRVREELEQIDRTLQRVLPPRQTAGIDPDSALLIGKDISTAPRFQGQLDVAFEVGQQVGQAVPEFRLVVDIKDGQVSVPGTPIRLTDVDAEFFADNQTVWLRLHRSRYDDAALRGQFSMQTTPNARPPAGAFELANFPVNRDLVPLCPASLQKLFDHFQPDLRASGGGHFQRRSDGKWIVEGFRADVTEGRLLHHRFQYPLTGIRAKLVQLPLDQTGGEVWIEVPEASGFGGETPWTARGIWKNPGPAVESHFEMHVADFPLDGRFRNALDHKARPVVESLDLRGVAGGRLWFDRPAGVGNKTQMKIDARVSDASMRFSKFPYPIEQLTGHLTFDSNIDLRGGSRWDFGDLRGTHGGAAITGWGSFEKRPATGLPGVLELTVKAEALALDADLYNALPASQRSLWELMDLSGLCDLTTRIHWTAVPGQQPVVEFPAESPVRIYQAKIRPKPFPYEMDVVEARVSFDPNDARFGGAKACIIQSFQARHKGAPLQATGWATSRPDGQWKVHLNDLNADGLPPDDELRAALPNSWREILTRLHHRGRISISDSEIEFIGIQEPGRKARVHAAWDMNLALQDCALNAGLDLKRVTGNVTARGSWDGVHLDNDGVIQLDSLRVLDMPLMRIHGPYSMDDARLVLGAEEVMKSGQVSKVDRRKRLAARAYGGTLFLDAVVDSRPGEGYVMFAELQNAQLQAFARENMGDANQLHGNVAAWLALRGEGESPGDVKGSGQLEISPAALYQIPVVLELLNALTSLNPGNRTAFDYAMLSFDVRDERFNFKRIDLVGKSLALRGRGYVGFGSDVWLDFYTRPPKPRFDLGNLLGGLVTQWAKVVVRGTISQPQADLAPTGQLDDSVRQFLNAFNATPGNVPRLSVPTIFPFAGNPLTFGPLPFRQQ